MKNGLSDGVVGSQQISDSTKYLEEGITEINTGQQQLLSGLNDLEDKMFELQDGLGTT